MESLTSRTIREIQSRIVAGQLSTGDKLGTLASLSDEFGVSRTVIREAVAALSSEGVLSTRHGVGVFVIEGTSETSRRKDTALLKTMSQFNGSFMDMLELRMAFEVHAAGLAAIRRSLAQEEAIWNAVRDFREAMANDAILDEIDYSFHRAVNQATNNTAFIEFFTLMGPRLLPPSTFSRDIHADLITDTYIEQTDKEHRAIAEQISRGDSEGARSAMHSHLTRAHDRYRGMIYRS